MQAQIHSLVRTLLIPALLTGLALAATPSHAQDDPPGAARLSHIVGNVSFEPNGEDAWGQASSNMPAGPGDRVFTDQGSEGELSGGLARAYFGPNTDLTLVNLNGQGIEYGLAQGSASFYSDGFLPGQSLFVSTPNGGVTLAGRGGFRVDVYPDQQSSVITNLQQGQIQLNGAGGFALTLGQNQSVQLSGTNPVYAQPLEPAPWDDFAHWSGAIESHRFNSPSAQYVSAEIAGYDELDGNGDWQPQSPYGAVWFPHVAMGWAPYHNGHWVHMPFYGWTWVADEPWGVAPFHYGRWVVMGGRWGWIPGPREGHPIWSPAQVVFAGGISVGGAGVSAWFPLGPGEPYHPWYPCTPAYVNQINVTNIRETTVVHVQVNYNVVNVTNITYVNRTSVVAMNTNDFASGRPAQAAPVRIDPKQVEHIQPAPPAAKPPAQRIMAHPVSKPPAAPAARPVLINHQGKAVSAAPNARPVEVPVKAAVVPKPIPGRAPAGAPSVGGKPVPAAMKPAPEPAKPAPAKPEPAPAKPAAPAPAAPAKPAPAKSEAAKPEAMDKPAPKAVAPAPAPKPAAPAPEAKPAPKPAETKPAAKPTPAAKDDKKKDDKKKDEKKPE